MTTPYIDPNLIFAENAPTQDKPAAFENYDKGWDESRKNDGRPSIKQMNYLQQQADLKNRYIHENGAALPYKEGVAYEENAVVVKDGVLQQWKDGEWVVSNPYFVKSPLEFLALPSNRLKDGRWTSQDGYSWDVSSDGVGDFILHGKQVTVLPLGGCLHFEAFGSVGTADVDVTDKFINFAAASSARKLPWVVGAGEHFINPSARVNFTTGGVTHGVIVMDRSNPNATIAFVRDDEGETVDVTAWNLTKGIRDIGATNAANKVVHIDSSEVLIERLNNPSYVKREMVLVDENGSISRPLTNTYNDKSKVFATAWEQSDPIHVKIRVKLIGTGTGATSGAIRILRDNCSIEEEYIRTGDTNLSLFSTASQCINTVFIRPKVEGVRLDGSGYGILFSSTLNSRVEFGNMPKCRHSISGRHNIDGVVLGGYYKDFDDHWGVNWLLQDCTFDPGIGSNCIGVAGEDLTVIRPTQLSGRSLTGIRGDTPHLAGRVIIENPTVFSRGDGSHYLGLFQITNPPALDFTTPPSFPDEIIITNPKMSVQLSGTNVCCLIRVTPMSVPHTPIGKIYISGVGDLKSNNTTTGVVLQTNLSQQLNRNTSIEIDGDFNFTGNAAYLYAVADEELSVEKGASLKLRGVSGNLRFNGRSLKTLDVSSSKIGTVYNDGAGALYSDDASYNFNDVEMTGGEVSTTFRKLRFNSCVFSGLYTQFPVPLTSTGVARVSFIACSKTVNQPNLPDNIMNEQSGFVGSSSHTSYNASDFSSAASTLNSLRKYAGLLAWDSTNNRMMRASGSSAADPWYVIDGSESVTPT